MKLHATKVTAPSPFTLRPRLALAGFAIGLSALSGCAASAVDPGGDDGEEAAESTGTSRGALAVAPAPTLGVTTLATGAGWQRVRITGTATDLETGIVSSTDEELVLISDPSAIDAAPLGATTKQLLKADLAASMPTASDALARAVDSDIVLAVSRTQAARVDSAGTTGTSGGASGASTCSNYDRTFDATPSKTGGFSATLESAGTFTGTATLSGSVGASALASLTVRVKRADTFLGCIPYAAAFRRVALGGAVDAQARIRMKGTYQREWHDRKLSAKIPLGSVGAMIGPIPISMSFSMPIETGIDAYAQGSVDIDEQYTAHAGFEISCTRQGCDGSKDASFDARNMLPPSSTGTNVKIDVTPWLSGSLRASLYSDAIAYGQVGLHAKTPTSFWFYSGDTCGDADGDGVNEYVRAGWVETALGIDMPARVSVLGKTVWSGSYDLLQPEIFFSGDLLFGASTALDPIWREVRVGGLDTVLDGPPPPPNTRRFVGGMRPCWPFGHAVKYQLTWGDGQTSEHTLGPGTFAVSHTFPTSGRYTTKLRAESDTANRLISGETTRIVGSPSRVVLERADVGGLVTR